MIRVRVSYQCYIIEALVGILLKMYMGCVENTLSGYKYG